MISAPPKSTEQQTLIEEAARLVRLVLPLMTKHGVPATPQNYAVWYSYVAGQNHELKTVIEEILQQGAPFSADQNEKLYRRFCCGPDAETLTEVREGLRRLLANLIAELSSGAAGVTTLQAVLTQSIQQVGQAQTVDELRDVIGDLTSAAQMIKQGGEEIRQRLVTVNTEVTLLQDRVDPPQHAVQEDFLTGLPNRQGLDTQLAEALAATLAHAGRMALLMIDVDHFKRFIDEHGRIVGDEVMRFIGRTLKDVVRGRDYVARYKDDQFVVILPDTLPNGARAVGENIRAAFERARLVRTNTSKSLGKITVSIGGSFYRSGEGAETLIERALFAMSNAKKMGRNRVVLETDVISRP